MDTAERGSRAIVAAFADRSSARDAAGRLRNEGFHHVWIGVTHEAEAGPDENVVESDSVGAKIGRFFGAGDRSLSEELRRHGVPDDDAGRIDAMIAPESAILTVDGAKGPEAAATIIASCSGEVLLDSGLQDLPLDDEAYVTEEMIFFEQRPRATERLGMGDDLAEEELDV